MNETSSPDLRREERESMDPKLVGASSASLDES